MCTAGNIEVDSYTESLLLMMILDDFSALQIFNEKISMLFFEKIIAKMVRTVIFRRILVAFVALKYCFCY